MYKLTSQRETADINHFISLRKAFLSTKHIEAAKWKFPVAGDKYAVKFQSQISILESLFFHANHWLGTIFFDTVKSNW